MGRGIPTVAANPQSGAPKKTVEVELVFDPTINFYRLKRETTLGPVYRQTGRTGSSRKGRKKSLEMILPPEAFFPRADRQNEIAVPQWLTKRLDLGPSAMWIACNRWEPAPMIFLFPFRQDQDGAPSLNVLSQDARLAYVPRHEERVQMDIILRDDVRILPERADLIEDGRRANAISIRFPLHPAVALSRSAIHQPLGHTEKQDAFSISYTPSGVLILTRVPMLPDHQRPKAL